jgi:hypothetical protein
MSSGGSENLWLETCERIGEIEEAAAGGETDKGARTVLCGVRLAMVAPTATTPSTADAVIPQGVYRVIKVRSSNAAGPVSAQAPRSVSV